MTLYCLSAGWGEVPRHSLYLIPMAVEVKILVYILTVISVNVVSLPIHYYNKVSHPGRSRVLGDLSHELSSYLPTPVALDPRAAPVVEHSILGRLYVDTVSIHPSLHYLASPEHSQGILGPEYPPPKYSHPAWGSSSFASAGGCIRWPQ